MVPEEVTICVSKRRPNWAAASYLETTSSDMFEYFHLKSAACRLAECFHHPVCVFAVPRIQAFESLYPIWACAHPSAAQMDLPWRRRRSRAPTPASIVSSATQLEQSSQHWWIFVTVSKLVVVAVMRNLKDLLVGWAVPAFRSRSLRPTRHWFVLMGGDSDWRTRRSSIRPVLLQQPAAPAASRRLDWSR